MTDQAATSGAERVEGAAENDAGLTRDPVDMADACLATWSTPGQLQMRHERGDHEHCPATWCETAAIYKQADEQCKRPRESSVTPPEASDQIERTEWAICTGVLFGRCKDGRMKPWRGTDGHNGTEWFYTCDRCGRTS